MPPGTQYPSQKLVFTDPLTGRTVWRMTTDGKVLGGKHFAAGDQSSESSSWSPDSTKIVYCYESGQPATKPTGIYMMDVVSGVETFLAPSVWYGSPVFARDGSNEVYYYDQSGGLVVKAVNILTFASRVVVALQGATWQEKIEVNADGSYISTHPRFGSTLYRTVIFTMQGVIHPNWELSGPTSDDGAVWHPTDPKRIVAVRGSETKIWNVDTLASTVASGLQTFHAALHPNGRWINWQGWLKDLTTGADVVLGRGMDPIHPNFNPTEGPLGMQARLTADDRPYFRGNTGRPRLHLPTIGQIVSQGNGIFNTVPPICLHYSRMDNNHAHVHAHWSPDGQSILWMSDCQDLRDGAPPGGVATGGPLFTDLFIVPMGEIQMPTPQPVNFNTAVIGWDWTRGVGGPMDNFRVECFDAVSGAAAIPMTTGDKQIAVRNIVQSLMAGTSVRCTVVAMNAGVDSDKSNELVLVNSIVSPPPPPPPPPAPVKPDAPTNLRVITP